MSVLNYDDLDFHFESIAVNEKNKKQNGEVFTPPSLIKMMIKDILELEPNLFKNKNIKILEPASGIGNYTFYLFKELDKGLTDIIPDKKERANHIITNCLYLIETNEKNIKECKKIFKEISKKPLNIYKEDALKKDFDFKFDLIIGNPPYNKAFLNNKFGPPLYHHFMDYYFDRCRILSLITPSKWLKCNSQYEKIRNKFFNSSNIRLIKQFDNACEAFNTKKIDICGGVSYFIKDSNFTGYCLYKDTLIDLSLNDILIEPKDIELIEKIKKIEPKLSEIYIPSSYFRLMSNCKMCHKIKKKDDILCHMSKPKGTYMYINKKYVKEKEVNGTIVIYHRVNKRNTFNDLRILKKDEVFTNTFNGFLVKNEEEAESLVSYLNTNFCKKLLSLRKITNGINMMSCYWILLPPLDRIWNDTLILKYYTQLNEFDFNLCEDEKLG